MSQPESPRELSRREFLGKSAAGAAVLALPPLLTDDFLLWEGWKDHFAADLLLPEEVLLRALNLLMARGADFGDVYVEKAAHDTMGSEDRKLRTTTLIEQGVGIRGVKDGRTFYAYTASFDPESVYETARYVADATAAAGSGQAVSIVDLTQGSSPLAFPITPDPASVEVEAKAAMVNALTDRAWTADDRVVQVGQALREGMRQVTLATSDGQLLNHTLGLTEFYAQTYLRDAGGNLRMGFGGRSAHAGQSFFTGDNSFEAIVDKSVHKARHQMEAVDSPRGTFPVVFGPGDTGTLFHESCGHGMEADLVFKGSNFKGQIGQKTAADGVTLIDDGTIPHLPGSFPFDDEGTPSQRTVLIEDGVQRNFLCDKIWGGKLGMASTGSGRRQSFRFPPIPRMRNTYIDAGTIPPEDIIKATKRGIYVLDAGGGGQVDVVSGNFMMGVSEAYLIEEGQVTRPVKGATLSGMGIQALQTIDMIGNDLAVIPTGGRCGKGQTAPTGSGMPTTRVRGIVVGGAGEAWDDVEGGTP
jgi:TldD protein